MKFRIFSATGLIGGLSVCSFTQAIAIEPPPDDAKPPAALLSDNTAPAPAPAAVENLPFVGLATASVPAMVADHLGIESGVIIRTVCPDSPAHKAGLSENDIILSLDGTAVANPEAFSAAIRSRKVGERMKVDLIHKGKPAKVEVTLTERPEELTAQLDPGAAPLNGIPRDHADRLRGLIEQNLLQPFGGGHGAFPDQQFENTFRMMRERMNRAFDEEMPQGAGGGTNFQQNSTIRLMDNDGSVEIKTSQGATDVTVRGTDNEVVWAGPWNTDEDKEAAPKEIRDRIDRVNSNSGSGFSFRFGKLRSDPDTIDN